MPEMVVTLVAVFISVALLSALLTSFALTRTAPGRRRLLNTSGMVRDGAAVARRSLAESPGAGLGRWAHCVPKSPKEMGRIEKRLAAAGHHGVTPLLVYCLAEIALALVGAVAVLSLLGWPSGIIFAIPAAVVGHMVPGFVVAHRIARRKKQIEDGLPDALDLLIVSLEAGLGIDQALLKCSEELDISYPALSQELRLINLETKAGKPRLEAFRNFARRTQVDDVRALVAMLVQTDRFGTSVAQALRTHAEVSRTKRRQRAEEKASKLGVKLVFPLVFCLLPAFFVVTVGPAIVKFARFFQAMKAGGQMP